MTSNGHSNGFPYSNGLFNGNKNRFYIPNIHQTRFGASVQVSNSCEHFIHGSAHFISDYHPKNRFTSLIASLILNTNKIVHEN